MLKDYLYFIVGIDKSIISLCRTDKARFISYGILVLIISLLGAFILIATLLRFSIIYKALSPILGLFVAGVISNLYRFLLKDIFPWSRYYIHYFQVGFPRCGSPVFQLFSCMVAVFLCATAPRGS